MLRVAQRKVDEAWQDLLGCHRLGRLIARGGTLIELLVGLAIDQIANKADLAFLEHAQLTSKQILACLDDLRKLPLMPPVANKIDLGERFMILDMIMLVARQGASSLEDLSRGNSKPPKGSQFSDRLFTHNINWDPAFRNANLWYDRYVAALRVADRTLRVKEI